RRPMSEDRPVRAEDAFDVAAVDAWLRAAGVAQLGDGLPEVRQFAGGASNLTYLLRYPARELILRRPPAGTKASSAHDMAREHRFQAALKPVFPQVPTMVALCTDPAVLGGDFYAMERVEGVIPRAQMPPEVDTDPALMARLGERFVDLLVELHAVDPDAAGLAELGRGAGYVRRQVDGWSERYRRAKTWNVPSFEQVMGWLDAQQPDDVGACVIHNDFRLDNMVLDRTADDPLRVRAVLDWELATIGDPLMDLGSSLAYWVQADDGLAGRLFRRQPSHLPGMPTRAQIVARYGARTGRSTDAWAFYEAFGLFRLAVIAQQIYYRYHHKQTRNPAFKRFWVAAHSLERRCRQVIRTAA
ncbi:MAG TPA: phosphotransferase family protein, partial [Conexibacter sp.]|nr:phosphotransferase family protein [Conexibacter sp.]